MAQQTSEMQQIGHVLWYPWHYRIEKKATNIPPYHPEIHQMLPSLSDSNTSHISKVVCIILLPDPVLKWFGEIRGDFHRMAQFSYFTDHRMAEAGGCLWRLLRPTSCSNRVSYSGFSRIIYLQVLSSQRFHNFSEQPVHVFDHPQGKNMFSCIQMECHVF